MLPLRVYGHQVIQALWLPLRDNPQTGGMDMNSGSGLGNILIGAFSGLAIVTAGIFVIVLRNRNAKDKREHTAYMVRKNRLEELGIYDAQL